MPPPQTIHRMRRRRRDADIQSARMKFAPNLRLPGLDVPLVRAGSHDCPYLPGREASDLLAMSPAIDGATYEQMMDRGFRRSGAIFYKPDCPACRECVPIRVPVDRFAPSRSQRRVLKRNSDVLVAVATPRGDDERFELYRRYQSHQHDGAMLGTREEFERFLCDSTLATIEMTYRAAGRLIGVGIVDVTPNTLSSVYFYFEPDVGRRSLGVYSALCEIELCRRMGKPWWYIGFHVRGCATMEYKAQYRPHELRGADGVWREPP